MNAPNTQQSAFTKKDLLEEHNPRRNRRHETNRTTQLINAVIELFSNYTEQYYISNMEPHHNTWATTVKRMIQAKWFGMDKEKLQKQEKQGSNILDHTQPPIPSKGYDETGIRADPEITMGQKNPNKNEKHDEEKIIGPKKKEEDETTKSLMTKQKDMKVLILEQPKERRHKKPGKAENNIPSTNKTSTEND
jgi:hypothetical protein